MESFVGDHSIIEEGVAIHMSVIGHTCSVGEKVCASECTLLLYFFLFFV